MKNIFIEGYWSKNLGDDLFLYLLLNRYPEHRFTILASDSASNVFSNSNLEKIYFENSFFTKIANKYCAISRKIPYQYKSLRMQDYDAYVEIGGSIFMLSENGTTNDLNSIRRERVLSLVKNYFIIGSNFGPFFSEYQLAYYSEFFAKTSGVCFRDEQSKKLFGSLDNIKCAPDVVLSLDTTKVPKYRNNSPYVTISIIDCKRKSSAPGSEYLAKYADAYVNKIVELVEEYLLSNTRVVLFSFCDDEGDLDVAKQIFNKVDSPIKFSLLEICSHNSIDESLALIKNSTFLIATRFHAMILGWVFQIPTYVISYSKKTEAVIDSFWKEQSFINICDIGNLSLKEMLLSEKIPSKKISGLKKDSENQFFFLDEFLNSKRK